MCERDGLFPLVIGVTGHRDPADRDSLIMQLEAMFDEFRALAPHTPIILLSPLAEGCDQLFAEVGLRALRDHEPGVELVVPLPFALDDYRCDFRPSSEALQQFDALLSQASMRIDLPPVSLEDLVDWPVPDGRIVRRVGSLPDLDRSEVRARYYDRVGRFMATHAQVMVSMWNGWNAPMIDNKESLVGGTASITRYCREGETTHDGIDIPLRAARSRVLATEHVPVIFVHTTRRSDSAESNGRADLSLELRQRIELSPSSTLEQRVRAGMAWRGGNITISNGVRTSELPAMSSDAHLGIWSDFHGALRRMEWINQFPTSAIKDGGDFHISPKHR
jgi:hypothetical protein